MSFRDNLQHLRAARDLSQAQLATLLGVSRQSVAKWEAEKSYPEMDKLIKLCDLFECSLDDLVRGDLAGREATEEGDEEAAVAIKAVEALCAAAEPADVEPFGFESVDAEPIGVEPAGTEPVDEFGYDEHMRRRAWDVAAGVAVIVIHLVGIAFALSFFVPAYRAHAAFRKEHPFIEDFYAPEEKAEARRRKTLGVGGCVALAVLGFYTPGMLATFQIYNQFPSLAMFACFAAAIALLVHTVMMDRRVDVSFYNGARDLTIQSLLRGRRTDA